ncbi:MAG: glycosyltransferase [Gemmatimonadaceae bacterium]|nr:glycosyltransferase [Gemmatimonadaceae bacterium]
MSGAPRLLFVTHNVPRFTGDAAGSFVLRLAVALRDAGAHVDILAPGAPGLAAHDELEGIDIERVAYARDDHMTLAYTGTMAEAVKGSWSGRLAFMQLLWAMRRATARAVSRARRAGTPYDVVHVHWWFPSGLALLGLSGATLPPRVITMHGSDVRLGAGLAPAHPIMRAVLKGAAVRTAVSSWLAATASRIAGVPVDVSPMPVDIRLFDAAHAQPAARRGVLFVGRLNAQKGIGDLLESMAAPQCAHLALDIVGDGPDEQSLRARATALGLDKRITWHGRLSQQDLAPRYRQAEVVVIPSRGEGLGLVAVEAQLCGTPVIAYADAGLLDVVQPAHGGTLVPPGDIAALSSAIAAVVSSHDVANTRGESARQHMLTTFSPAAVAERYLSHYAVAIGGSRVERTA